MKTKVFSLFLGLTLALTDASEAAVQTTTLDAKPQSVETKEPSTLESIKKVLGVTYFVFFDGPGLDPDNRGFNPNSLGRASWNGITSFNMVSFRWKAFDNIAIDLQTRTRFIYNNARGREEHTSILWESPRIGISGTLLSGKDWKLSGALNSDFPYFFPEPLGGGYTVRNQTTLFQPGLFTNFSYRPSGSRWSIFSLFGPRYRFYKDRLAIEPESSRGGFGGLTKPELSLWLAPTVNYALSPKTSLRAGFDIDYRKVVASDWNPFRASINAARPDDPAWRLSPLRSLVGMNFDISSAFSIFPFIQTFPIAAQRVDARGNQASLMQTTSFCMWLSGTLL